MSEASPIENPAESFPDSGYRWDEGEQAYKGELGRKIAIPNIEGLTVTYFQGSHGDERTTFTINGEDVASLNEGSLQYIEIDGTTLEVQAIEGEIKDHDKTPADIRAFIEDNECVYYRRPGSRRWSVADDMEDLKEKYTAAGGMD